MGPPGEPFSQDCVLSSRSWSFFPPLGDSTWRPDRLYFVCREWVRYLGCLQDSQIFCPRHLMHAPPTNNQHWASWWSLWSGSQPDGTSLHLLFPTFARIPPLPFPASIVIWCELDVLPVRPELGAQILLRPHPMFLPLTGSLAFSS